MAGKKKGKKNSKKTKKQSRAPSQVQTRDAQESSRLFRIPQEVPRSDIHPIILRHQIISWAEIGDSWLGQVLFSFEDTETMTTKLAALPVATLSKIRHIRIRGETLMLSWPDDDVHYLLVLALKLLPGLQLDTLTVLNLYGGLISYDVLNTLIRYGQGWKELRFISHASELLGFAREHDISAAGDKLNARYQLKPQPADWIRAMNNRDGAASQPSVTIYRSTLAGQPCTVSDEATRVRFEQKLSRPDEEDAFATQECGDIMSPGERTKELMVVVRRGRGVDYQEKPGSPFLPTIGDIRRDCPGMTWAEIKKQHVDRPSDPEDDVFGFSDDDSDDLDSV
ncbi:hypothetical protein F5B21DRAFT_529006 [Xylaria acuta]|nr:hypothetical protein F5B21DRAFT_529006 [Xylaria acuta]